MIDRCKSEVVSTGGVAMSKRRNDTCSASAVPTRMEWVLRICVMRTVRHVLQRGHVSYISATYVLYIVA